MNLLLLYQLAMSYSALWVPKPIDKYIYWKGLFESLAGLLRESFKSIITYDISTVHVSGTRFILFFLCFLSPQLPLVYREMFASTLCHDDVTLRVRAIHKPGGRHT